jgi:hypothetical protein
VSDGRRRYKEVFVGGPFNGQRKTVQTDPSASSMEMNQPCSNDDTLDRLGFHKHLYYRRMIHLLGRGLVFWVHAPLIRSGKDEEAILDFLLFGLET